METEKLKALIESCHLNFLIGSGASRDHLGTLGNIETLLTELTEKVLSEDQTILVDAIIKYQYYLIAIKGNLEIENGTTADLVATKNAYKGYLNTFIELLKRRKSNLLSKQINLFTTNMDLFHEYTLEELGASYNDGFSGRLKTKFGTENYHNTILKTSTHYDLRSEVPLFNLYKLHGSLNWLENGDEILYDYALDLLKQIESLTFPSAEFISIFKGDDSPMSLDEIIQAISDNSITKSANHERFLEAYNKLVMINPTKDKFATTTQNLLFYELLRMYSNHLEKENSILFVIGFSFADEHIREITKRVSQSNPTLLIVIFAYNQGAKTSIESLVGEASNIKVLAPNDGDSGYSLERVNETYFKRVLESIDKISE
ncbi:SIR2 family protein [Roseivirga pacifica]|uniref:SIR2 family protein n=1 Tax=Roseivirga pacifica TaxID=1267423 RepID=UPI003BB1CD7B